jgi:hypothetical protein
MRHRWAIRHHIQSFSLSGPAALGTAGIPRLFCNMRVHSGGRCRFTLISAILLEREQRYRLVGCGSFREDQVGTRTPGLKWAKCL